MECIGWKKGDQTMRWLTAGLERGDSTHWQTMRESESNPQGVTNSFTILRNPQKVCVYLLV